MSDRGAKKAGFLSQLASCPCPTCGYELRLAIEASKDGTVRCSECGNTCDVAAIESKLKPMPIWGWVWTVLGTIVPWVAFFATLMFLFGVPVPGVTGAMATAVRFACATVVTLLILAAFSVVIMKQARAVPPFASKVIACMVALVFLNLMSMLILGLVATIFFLFIP